MRAIHITIPEGHEIPAHEVPAGIVGFTSWRRLEEIFRRAGEINSRERLIGVQIDDRGITFRVEMV